MSARDVTAFPGVEMQRTVAVVRDTLLDHPVLIDVFRLTARSRIATTTAALRRAVAGHQCRLRRRSRDSPTPGHPTTATNTCGWKRKVRRRERRPSRSEWRSLLHDHHRGRSRRRRSSSRSAGAQDPKFNLRPERALSCVVEARNMCSPPSLNRTATGIRPTRSRAAPSPRTRRAGAGRRPTTVTRCASPAKDGLKWTLLISNRAIPARHAHACHAGRNVHVGRTVRPATQLTPSS